MNRIKTHLLIAFSLLLLATTSRAQDRSIDLQAVTTLSSNTVILDLIADTNGISLRSFGLTVVFPSDSLELQSAGRYEEIWFLSRESGERLPYTDTRPVEKDRLRVIGGRLAAGNPVEGVNGPQVLLATLVFNRRDATTPRFSFEPAGGASFAGFVEAGGGPVDELVQFDEVKVIEQSATSDRDEDGLPDLFEEQTFGDLQSSDGKSDTDGDGDSDYDEWVKGTDPTDRESRCVLTVAVLGDGSKLLQWNGKPGRVYEIQRGRSLRAFEVLAAGLPGEDDDLSRLDETAPVDPTGFYRIKVRFPTAR